MKDTQLRKLYDHLTGLMPVGQPLTEEAVISSIKSTAQMFGQSLSVDNIKLVRQWISERNNNSFQGEKVNNETDIIDSVTTVPDDTYEFNNPPSNEAESHAQNLGSMIKNNGDRSINDLCAIAAAYAYGATVAHSKKVFGDYEAPEDVILSRKKPVNTEFVIDDWTDDTEVASIVQPNGENLNTNLDNPTLTEKAVSRWANSTNQEGEVVEIDGYKYLKYTNGYYILIGKNEVRSVLANTLKGFKDGWFGSMIDKNPGVVDDPMFKLLNKHANRILGAIAGK